MVSRLWKDTCQDSLTKLRNMNCFPREAATTYSVQLNRVLYLTRPAIPVGKVAWLARHFCPKVFVSKEVGKGGRGEGERAMQQFCYIEGSILCLTQFGRLLGRAPDACQPETGCWRFGLGPPPHTSLRGSASDGVGELAAARSGRGFDSPPPPCPRPAAEGLSPGRMLPLHVPSSGLE